MTKIEELASPRVRSRYGGACAIGPVDQASRNGVILLRDQPVELRCRFKEYSDATFLIW